MISFASDYLEGMLPEVLERLSRTNLEQTPGYGEDVYCEQAARLLKKRLEAPEAAVHFLVGGTQANAVVVRSLLRPHQGVLAAETGHVAVHEAGAIEAGGHKVLTLAAPQGKLQAADVRQAIQAHWQDATREHMVQPGLIYLSQPTELGTLYTRAELAALKAVAEAFDLALFIDGARLAMALACPQSDLTLADYRHYCDALTVGGTKCGLPFGEALVFFRPALARDFRYIQKQMGALLAKGRLLGLSFLTLFEDDLYVRAAGRALEAADRLRELFAQQGFSFLCDSPTNQLFPVLPDRLAEALRPRYAFEFWQKITAESTCYRFVTSWATREESLQAFARDLARLAASGGS